MHEREQKAEFDLLMASRSWPADRLQALQRSRIEKLIAHARAHSPFYANRFDAFLKRNGDLDWDRWHEIPTVKRSDLVEHRRAMLSRSVPEEHGNIIDVSSSGSTGRPVTTAHTTLALKRSKAVVYRAQVDDDVDFGTRLGLWMGTREEAPSPDGTLGDDGGHGGTSERLGEARAKSTTTRRRARSWITCGATAFDTLLWVEQTSVCSRTKPVASAPPCPSTES